MFTATLLRSVFRVAAFLFGAFCLDVGSVQAKDATQSTAEMTARRVEATQFFRAPMSSIQLVAPEEGIEHLRKDPRSYIDAELRSDGKSYGLVELKLKGAEGSFRPVDEKPCFTIAFKKHAGATFHGLEKFHLNNAREDPSFLRQTICGEIARSGGVPAARCTHAFVRLNERDLGLYVLVESYTRDFLADFYKDTGGALFEGGFCKDIDEGLILHFGASDVSEIDPLLAACREEDSAQRWQKLRTNLDVDRYASFLAMESLLGVGDGYDFFRNNYRLYREPKTHLVSFILHGMDEPIKDVNFPIQRSPDSIVGRAFISDPEGRRLYRERAADLYQRAFLKTDWPARVDELIRRVQAGFAATHREPDGGLMDNMKEFRGMVKERVERIGAMLADLPEPPVFDKAGVALLTKGWFAQTGDNAKLDRANVAGEAVFRITMSGPGQASWRLSLQLGAGKYRFTAKLKTSGVRGGTGAGLRISGHDPAGEWSKGDGGWLPVSYEFEIGEGGGDVVLVAELRASSGTVLFADKSMQLVHEKEN